MMEQMDHLQLFFFLAGLIAAWSLIMLAVQKYTVAAGFSSLVEKIDQLRAATEKSQAAEFKSIKEQIEQLQKASEKIQGFERQILELRADLPLNYVRKEDFIRHEVVINTKLDRLRDLIESLRERREGKRQEDK